MKTPSQIATKLIVFSVFFIVYGTAFAQNTVGLIEYTGTETQGYVLLPPMGAKNTYLLDRCGQVVHSWESAYRPGLSAFLTEDGSLYRSGYAGNTFFTAGGNGGILERYDWDGNLIWNYTISNDSLCQHHDFKVLPNGNILVIVWHRKSYDEAVANGKNPAATNAYVWSEKIVELEPIGSNQANTVWEWQLWDHLVQDYDAVLPNYGVVADHPELINLNYVSGPPLSQDWIHLNSIDYNSDLDQIVVSSHNFDEIWIIDHSTTTAEASGHSGGNAMKGGDILYRWGNPQTYNRGTSADARMFGQHHATWIPTGYPDAGKILYFNNGTGRPDGAFSTVDYIAPPLNGYNYDLSSGQKYAPTDPNFSYAGNPTSDFYSFNISGVYPLKNGGFLVTSGASGQLFEINNVKERVWKYVNPVTSGSFLSQGDTPANNLVFRAAFYDWDYAAFAGKTLTPSGPLELNPSDTPACKLTSISDLDTKELQIYPNPSTGMVFLNESSLSLFKTISLSDQLGRVVYQHELQGSTVDLSILPDGFYTLNLEGSKAQQSFRLVLMR